MDITIYLPDELGRRAKAAELPLSRMLRDAVIEELERQDTVTRTLQDPQTFELDLEDRDGNSYRGRITGAKIAEDNDYSAYLTTDERVIVHEEHKGRYTVLDCPEDELANWLRGDAYIEAMNALGLTPVVDL